MTRRIACLTLVAAAVVAAAPAPAPAATCRPPAAAHDVVRGSRTVVWWRQDAVIGCSRRTGRRYELVGWASDAGYEFVPHRLATNGDLAAVAGHYYDKYGSTYLDAAVADVRRRRDRTAVRIFPSQADLTSGQPVLSGFVLAPSGTVALTYSWAHPPRVEAFRPSRTYLQGVLLDDAAEASGLRLLSPTTVAWRHGGEERTAELPR